MIEAKNVSGLNSIKKEAGTGSYKGMRWRLEKDEEGKLKCSIYPEPKSYANTPAEEILVQSFEFSADGLNAAIEYLNNMYLANKEKWDSAPKL